MRLRSVIEHKRCPTGNKSQLQNLSQYRQFQNANTSHAAETCRICAGRCAGLRVGRRAVLRVGRCANLSVERRIGLRAGRSAGCASQDASVARRKTRRLLVARRAVFAPRDALFARRKTRRLRATRRAECAPYARACPSVFFRGGGRRLEVIVRRVQRVADGAASPG